MGELSGSCRPVSRACPERTRRTRNSVTERLPTSSSSTERQNNPSGAYLCPCFVCLRKNEENWLRRWNGWLGRPADVDALALLRSNMSKLPSVLSATDEEIQLLLAAQCHIGTKNCDKQMEPYVWKRRSDGASGNLRLADCIWTRSLRSFLRHSHHQHWQDLGEARVCCPYHCCHREP